MQRILSICWVAVFCGAAVFLLDCAEPQGEPERVVVQHVLISFVGKLPGKPIKRTEEEARRLAYEVLDRAKRGEDFDALVKEHTDDQHPGIYAMANQGAPPQKQGEYQRDSMVQGFGDVSFSLGRGELGICDYDGVKSPFGYHIIKRLE